MNFEILKLSHLKRNIIISIIVVLIISAIVLNFTRAKYRVTQSIPLVNGTINYTPYDFTMVAMYQEDDSGEYVSIGQVPSSGYILNAEQSYCEVNGERDNNTQIEYKNGLVNFLGVSEKGTKCYLYFDEQALVRDMLLANYSTQLTRTNFDEIVTDTTTGTIYYEDTSKGRTYYFAGNPTDNLVRWAGFYWRIIRINEDGTIRMIYQGTSANTTGSGTQLQKNSFNDSYDDNMYAGYMYTSGSVHGLGKSSTIKGILDNWYENNLLIYTDDLDGNAGFCNDRLPSTSNATGNGSGGIGTTVTYYGAYIRLYTNKAPTFECENSSDLYTTSGSSQGNGALQYPVGLIGTDEVAYAGGVYGSSNINQSYYLYTGEDYWTMSPYDFCTFGWLNVSIVNSNGCINSAHVSSNRGVRPVVNLKADVTISGGNGTSETPYVVS